MSSVPYQQQQQIPLVVYPNAASSNGNGNGEHSKGSVGPVLVVLSIIAILSVVACVAGRICAGRLFSSNTKYDCVGWMEQRCKSCIDGDIEGFGGGPLVVGQVIAENGEPQPENAS